VSFEHLRNSQTKLYSSSFCIIDAKGCYKEQIMKNVD